jgi:hypothetical protein
LLQPASIFHAPIQPQLAESNLYSISSGGAALICPFENSTHCSIVTRFRFKASGLAAEQGTWGGDVVLSGIYRNLSLSAGMTRFNTDGWRDNADQEDNIANFFAQLELNYKTSIQAEYRSRENERGQRTTKGGDRLLAGRLPPCLFAGFRAHW